MAKIKIERQPEPEQRPRKTSSWFVTPEKIDDEPRWQVTAFADRVVIVPSALGFSVNLHISRDMVRALRTVLDEVLE